MKPTEQNAFNPALHEIATILKSQKKIFLEIIDNHLKKAPEDEVLNALKFEFGMDIDNSVQSISRLVQLEFEENVYYN